MTTPTTPAADAVRDAFEQWVASEGGPTTESLLSARSNDDHYKGFIWLRQSLAVFRAATALATARESALIAERDALLIAGGDLANCAYNLAQRSGEVLSARSAVALDNARRKWDAALSAPAVEG